MSILRTLLTLLDQAIHATRVRLKRVIPKESTLYALLRCPSMALREITPRIAAAYRKSRRDGVFCREDELGMASCFPEKVLSLTMHSFQPKSVLDLGCGTGVALEWFRAQGVEVVGVEASKLAASHALHPELIIIHDLRTPLKLNRTFDLVWSFEVVEHIAPEFVESLVDSFVRHGDLIVMSAAQPGQGGEGHFNEQPTEYWVEKFDKRGFHFDQVGSQKLRDTKEFCSQNMMIFLRKTPRQNSR
jgi:SAM-dependent methyltransferase